jgi:CRP-like cAMP-binding protein
MFILLQGELKVVFDDGRELSRIRPVQTVGEMGIFTGENRSASVVTAANSILFAIHRKELVDLFRKDSDLGILILTNVIRDISGKLKISNMLIEELKKAPKSASTG